jgi:hypothetical protein
MDSILKNSNASIPREHVGDLEFSEIYRQIIHVKIFFMFNVFLMSVFFFYIFYLFLPLMKTLKKYKSQNEGNYEKKLEILSQIRAYFSSEQVYKTE